MEDDVLPELYDVLANILNALDFEQVADLASRKRYNALQNVAKSRFGASIICKLLDRGQVSLSQLSIQVCYQVLFLVPISISGISCRCPSSVARFSKDVDSRHCRVCPFGWRSSTSSGCLPRPGQSFWTIPLPTSLDQSFEWELQDKKCSSHLHLLKHCSLCSNWTPPFPRRPPL